jgi:hypothetical protein
MWKLDITTCSSSGFDDATPWSGAKLIEHSNNFMFTLPVHWLAPMLPSG